MENRARAIVEENDRERKADYFKRIRLGKTSEYRALIASVDQTFSTPEQKSRAISFLGSGMATSASEAKKLMQEEDLEDRNTQR